MRNKAEIVFDGMTIDTSMVECRSGWQHLYLPILALARDQAATVAQVKEKFGALRIYVLHNVDADYEALDTAIRSAEIASMVTCEVCGAPGVTGGRAWIQTLCDTHRGAPLQSMNDGLVP